MTSSFQEYLRMKWKIMQKDENKPSHSMGFTVMNLKQSERKE